MRRPISPQKELWITNTSKKGVTLHDLNITLLPGQSYNLLSKGARLTPKQINESVLSGSIYNNKKNKRIIIRKLAPKENDHIRSMLVNETPRLSARKNAVEVKEVYYEELDINDESLIQNLEDQNEKDKTDE